MQQYESDRIADTLRDELEVGRWRAGDRLPSVDELCERFGVGPFAVRAAVRKLRDEGLVDLRQRVGIVATQKGGLVMNGRVLFVAIGPSLFFFVWRLVDGLSRRFDEARWSFDTVFLYRVNGDVDISPLARKVAFGVRLAVVLACEHEIMDALELAGVPYIVLNGYGLDWPRATGVVRDDVRGCYDDLVKALLERRVKSVVEFEYARTMDRSFKAQLAAAGIPVRRVFCERESLELRSLTDVKRLGHSAVARFFSVDSNRANPPDVVLFDDDHLADGGLVALYETGLRIPEDIGVVFYSNKGDEPVLGVSTARIENDPALLADIVADYSLNLLAGCKCEAPKNFLRYIPGDSL